MSYLVENVYTCPETHPPPKKRGVCLSCRFNEFKIQNMVGSCDVKFPIRLEGLMYNEGQLFANYEPEIFPG